MLGAPSDMWVLHLAQPSLILLGSGVVLMTRREAQEPEELRTLDEWFKRVRWENGVPTVDAPLGDRNLPVVASCSEYQFTGEDYVCKGCGKRYEKDPTEDKLWALGVVLILALLFIAVPLFIVMWVGR